MSDGTVTVPVSWVERFNSMFDRLLSNQPGDQPPPPAVPDDYAALQAKAAEVDQLAARIATMEAEAAKQARLSHFTAEVGKTKVARDGAAEMLAGMSEEQSKWVLQQFAALSAQIDESALLGEIGVTGGGPVSNDPKQAFNAAVLAKAKEAKVDYNAALELVKVEQPDLFAAYVGGK